METTREDRRPDEPVLIHPDEPRARKTEPVEQRTDPAMPNRPEPFEGRAVDRPEPVPERMSPGTSIRMNAFRDKLEALEREMNARIDEMHARLDKNIADCRVHAAERIDALERKRDEVRERLRAWRESGNDLDERTRREINKSLEDMEKSIKKAGAKLKC